NNDSVFDPFGTNGVGTSLFTNIGGSTAFGGGLTGGTATSNSNYVRASNAVQYFLPSNIGGFYGQFMYGLHEKVKYDPVTFPAGANGGLPALNQARTGRYVGGRVGYANGPLDVGVAYGQSTIGDNFFAGITNNLRQASLGASFDFGVAKLFGEVTEIRNVFKYDTPVVTQTTQLGAKLRGALVGVTVPVGPGLIRASYARMKADIDQDPFALYNREDPKADKFSLGYVHNLSKRTALYATVARIVNKNGFAASVGGAPAFTNTAAFGANTGLYTGYQARNSTGYDIGVRHSF
ncbi:MAG: porin, partial [Comamonadaceae bacterium]